MGEVDLEEVSATEDAAVVEVADTDENQEHQGEEMACRGENAERGMGAFAFSSDFWTGRC